MNYFIRMISSLSDCSVVRSVLSKWPLAFDRLFPPDHLFLSKDRSWKRTNITMKIRITIEVAIFSMFMDKFSCNLKLEFSKRFLVNIMRISRLQSHHVQVESHCVIFNLAPFSKTFKSLSWSIRGYFEFQTIYFAEIWSSNFIPLPHDAAEMIFSVTFGCI